MTNKTLYISAYNENINLLIYTIQNAHKMLGVNKVRIADDASDKKINKKDITPWVDVEDIEVTRNTNRLGVSLSRHKLLETVSNNEIAVIADAHLIITRQKHKLDNIATSKVIGWTITPFIDSGRVPTIVGVERPRMLTHVPEYTSSTKDVFGPCSKCFAISGENLIKIGGYCPLLEGTYLTDTWLALRCRVANINYGLITEPIKHYNVCEGKTSTEKLDKPWMAVYNHMTIADCAAYRTPHAALHLYNWYRGIHERTVCDQAMELFQARQADRDKLKPLFITDAVNLI